MFWKTQPCVDSTECALSRQRVKDVTDRVIKLETEVDSNKSSLASQGARVGTLEGFQKYIEKQDIDKRLTHMETTLHNLNSTLQKFHETVSLLDEKVIATTILVTEQKTKFQKPLDVTENITKVFFEVLKIGIIAGIGVLLVTWKKQ